VHLKLQDKAKRVCSKLTEHIHCEEETHNESSILDKTLKKSGRHISDINAKAAKEMLCMIFLFHPQVAYVVLGILRD